MNPLLIKAAPYLGISLLLLIGKCGYDANQREIGAMRERLKTTSDSLLLVKARGRQIDSIYVRDTVRLMRTLVRRDTVLKTVDRYIRENVPVPVEVVREVLKADSQAIAACLITVTTCESRVANLTNQLSLITTQRDAYRKLAPSGFQTARSTLTTAALSFGLAYLLLRR